MEVLNISGKEFRFNDGIDASEVLVIGADGAQLGVLPLKKALKEAESVNMDLVQVSAGDIKNNRPPTCKIMDYGKYCYEQGKKGKEARKKQKVIEIKEIRLSVNIDIGDFKTKVKKAMEFLEKGRYKVKVSIRFRGRENSNPARGYEIMGKFAQECSALSNVEVSPKLEGRNMFMFLAPKTLQTKNGSKLSQKGDTSEGHSELSGS